MPSTPPPHAADDPAPGLGPGLALGLDAGGTMTRWALATADGRLVAEGTVAGFGAAMLATPEGQARLRDTLAALAQAVRAVQAVHAVGRPLQVHGGITGYGGQREPLAGLIGAALGVDPAVVTLASDVEVGYLGCFQPGEGYLVYAGTGSIGVFIDADGVFHRVGGRGGLLDDGGSGYWIAREALRHIWRTEDESPGAWQGSPMARAVLERLGGADWSHTRRFITSADRGEMGRLALAVAATADADPVARQILQQAGAELGRLARILVRRHGPRPVALAGRVFALHPAIAEACRAEVGETAEAGELVEVRPGEGSPGHHAAARIAARRLGPSAGH